MNNNYAITSTSYTKENANQYIVFELKDISKILGHSRVETTENYYIFNSYDDMKKTIEILEKSIK